MQEVLSKTDDPKAPLRDQEFYELRLYDSDSAGEPVYCVREARAQWNDSIKGVEWDEPEIGAFGTLQEAKERTQHGGKRSPKRASSTRIWTSSNRLRTQHENVTFSATLRRRVELLCPVCEKPILPACFCWRFS
jgi:hypothetical protein